VFSRLFALVVLLALVAAGLYFWKGGPSGFKIQGLGDVGEKIEDAKVLASAKAALGLNRTLKPYAIAVSVEAAVATLRGEVPSEGVRQQAEAVVAAVPGVKQVVNHLQVSAKAAATETSPGRSLGESLDDGTLEVQARLALSLRKELQGTDITVKVFRKELTLGGEVVSAEQRTVALATARDVAGVENVVDRIRLGRGGTKDQAQPSPRAAEAAEAALRSNPNLKNYNLTVADLGGHLVVRGRVRTGAERDLAGLLAQGAASVPVENALEIRP
jgi:hyperosmotically inducible periplasmic protein